jgi:nucleoside-diphosphate-sugar epimerase
MATVDDWIGDLGDPAVWSSMPADLDVIFHLAAQTSAYRANSDPTSDLRSNVLPMQLLLKACEDQRLSPVVVSASTATICGIPSRLPVDENFPDKPITVYDLHKQMAENYLKFHVRIGNIRGAVLRLSNVYGPGPRSSSADRGILNQMVGRALRGEPLTVYGRGEHLRDYVYIEDVVRAFIIAPMNIDALNGGHYLIGRGEGHTISQAIGLVAERIASYTGMLSTIRNIPPPKGISPIEMRSFIADTRRFSRATGWRAHQSLTRGIDRLIESQLTN